MYNDDVTMKRAGASRVYMVWARIPGLESGIASRGVYLFVCNVETHWPDSCFFLVSVQQHVLHSSFLFRCRSPTASLNISASLHLTGATIVFCIAGSASTSVLLFPPSYDNPSFPRLSSCFVSSRAEASPGSILQCSLTYRLGCRQLRLLAP